MSLARRKASVAEAEAQALACIEQARSKVAASRADRDSLVYPAVIGAGGVIGGVLLEHIVTPAGRPARAGKPREESSSSHGPSWLSLANFGLAVRTWHQAKPLLDSLAAGSGVKWPQDDAGSQDGTSQGGPADHGSEATDAMEAPRAEAGRAHG
jgi:hypothetical protein